MTTLYLSDILKKTGLDLNKVKLIRHAKSDKGFRRYYDEGLVQEYTSTQRDNFSPGYEYWIVFISDAGTSAVLEGCYRVLGSKPFKRTFIPERLWDTVDGMEEKLRWYDLERIDALQDFEGRLVIDWGKSTRMWHQKATTEKEVLSIQSKEIKHFTGYEDLVLIYDQLKEIIDESGLYSEWHAALSSVYGIYLITDTVTGRQYVGSAYGGQGILQRWTDYINTKHGGNRKIRKLLSEHPERYKQFQFSILQILSKTTKDDDVIEAENRWKKKLLSKEFGLNDN